jgi:hypothetical protein
MCNSRFLLNYGFAVEDNRDPDGKCHNEVRLEFRLAPKEEDGNRLTGDPHLQTKLGLLDGTVVLVLYWCCTVLLLYCYSTAIILILY